MEFAGFTPPNFNNSGSYMRPFFTYCKSSDFRRDSQVQIIRPMIQELLTIPSDSLEKVYCTPVYSLGKV